MFPHFFHKRGGANDGTATSSRKSARVGESVEPSTKNSNDSLNVLLGYSNSAGVAPVLNAIGWDVGKGKASMTSSEKVGREVTERTLTLPGYCVTAMIREVRMFAREYDEDSARYFDEAHVRSQAFVYSVYISSKVEEYLSLRAWEKDRTMLTRMLHLRGLVEHPNKPLLLLVTHEQSEKDDDFDLDRLVTLFGLGRLQRPFRAVAYSKALHDSGTLKEALDWLTTTANSNNDESTTMMTGYATEDDSSVVTSNSTAVSMAKDGHYVMDYEPTLLGGNATLQWFETIKKGTHCPFARAAKLWGGKLEEEERPRLWRHRSDEVRRVASLNAAPLAEFVSRCNEGEQLDGFCLLLPLHSHTVKELGHNVRILLTELADLDPAPGENAMTKMGRIDDPQWRFRFAGEDFFITTFSPVYKKHSSRYAFRTGKSFVLFQPLPSFGRHGLMEDTPASATNWENPTTMRDKARVAFKRNGCPYHIPEKLPYPVAEHIVKPVKDDGTSCVRWWEPNDK